MKKLFLFVLAATMLFSFSACTPAEVEEVDDQTQEVVEEVVEEKPVKKIIKLYYYNLEEDKKIDDSIPCSADAVLPVEREVSESQYRPVEALRMLLRGDITDEEAAQGFQTEFAPGKLEYKSWSLANGSAIVDFKDDDGFTTGGSCRVGLLATQIQKTLLQFDNVDEVTFANEGMFQP